MIGYKINVHNNNQPKVKNYCNYNNHNNKIDHELLNTLELPKITTTIILTLNIGQVFDVCVTVHH